jgi:ribosome-associated protein
VKASTKPVVKASTKPAEKASTKPAEKASTKPAVKATAKPVAKESLELVAKSTMKEVAEAVTKPIVKEVTKPAVKIAEKGKVIDSLLIEYVKELGAFLEEKKGENISLLDLRRVNSFLDYFIVCTGNSHAHLRSMSKETQRFFSERGIRLRGMSDLSTEWIVLDYSEIVIHLFSEEARGYYDLDKLWSDAVRL